MRIVMAQLNLQAGDIVGNLQKHIHAAIQARDHYAANVIVYPELGLTGYPAEDVWLRPAFIDESHQALKKFQAEVRNIYCLIGHPRAHDNALFNACSLIYNGEIVGQYAKQRLPNYGVFDEARYFTPGTQSVVLPIHDVPCGLVICEDLWKLDPVRDAAAQGAKLILSPNASPYEIDKHEQRISLLTKRAQQHHLAFVYANHVGGQDELIFDGGSMAVNRQGELCQFAGFFKEALLPVEVDSSGAIPNLSASQGPITIPHQLQRIYDALVLSVRDYINKNHFSGALVGISGGIDSSLTLAIATDAIGQERVRGVIMPSRYTDYISIQDAKELAQALGVQTETISIGPVYTQFLESLAPSFVGKKPDITEENIQARCRAVILMALSNKYGHIVLTTGNRSELAVGYCTLYGDMAGGFAVLKDIPKTLVYQLSKYRNQLHPVIPERTIQRPPTAELAPNQKDEDILPPYSVLDRILELYLNQTQSIEEIIAQGFSRELVRDVVNKIYKNEYKRRQAAIGPRINHKSFGKDWRYPITNGFKG